ncbi:hypothetical protein EDB80DRAFT_715001 [Ilyonectria destructans]|nr:hypothetical protein EDB80DRAFT_715001 [Ilyonectria destructans]
MAGLLRLNFLSPRVSEFLGLGASLHQDEDRASEGSGLVLWKRLQQEMQVRNVDGSLQGAFESTLRRPLQKSWRILDDWWNGRYHPPINQRDDASILELVENSTKLHDGTNHEARARLTYESTLGYLFFVEMILYQTIRPLDGIPLAQLPARAKEICREMDEKATIARMEALKYASLQMIGHSSYLEAVFLQAPLGAGGSFGKTVLGTTLEPCWWLRLESIDSLKRPFYLWDRHARQTMETELLGGSCPPYYCISHTWGRWRTGAVRLPGIPWPVPENTRFNVSEMAEVFSRLDWPVNYVWFDLFCIPQEKCLRQAQEIAKQADIFHQAEVTIVWLNDVMGWKVMENAVLWLGLNFLRNMNPGDLTLRKCHEEFTRTLNDASSRMTLENGLLNPWCPVEMESTVPTEGDSYANDPGPKWFSSLWTLQEAYLCPSALLADRDFNCLSISSGGILVTLDNIAALAYSRASDVDGEEDLPTMVRVLMFTIKRWELADLSDQSRTSILIAAESRVATGSRAEAIMSALGFTSWYKAYWQKHQELTSQQDLVLGLYPAEFLHEAHSHMGGTFWLHRRAPPNTLEDVEAGNPIGSLLPVSHNGRLWQVTQSDSGVFKYLDYSGGMTSHWYLRPDGTVLVTRAAILAQSSQILLCDGADGPIFVSTASGEFEAFGSFRNWVGTLLPVPCRFVVAVTRYAYRHAGVILEGKQSREVAGELILVKTGVFSTSQRWCTTDVIPVSSVNWLVL